MSTTHATLVIPDVHNNYARAEAYIAHLAGRYERIVFLGDYFDDYGDQPGDTLRVAEWLEWSMAQPNRIHLVGNHDLAYLWPGSFTWCSGFEDLKMLVAAPVLDRLPRGRFRAAIEVDGWLLSHAGFHPSLSAGKTAGELVEMAAEALRELGAGERPALFAAGYARGGNAPVGGITWLDWAKEFQPTAGLHQIVGHTPADTLRVVWLGAGSTDVGWRAYGVNVAAGEVFARGELKSLNICIDTQLGCVALLENGAATVFSRGSLPGEADDLSNVRI